MSLLRGLGWGATVALTTLALVACGKDEEPAAAVAEAEAGAKDATIDEAEREAAADSADAALPDADAEAGSSTPVTGYTIVGEINYPFLAPYALAIDSKDHVYVSEQTDAPDTHTLYLASRSFAPNVGPGRPRIHEFDETGTYLGWIGAGNDNSKGFHNAGSTATAVYGYDPAFFNMIRGMAFDAADNMYVLDSWRIQQLNAAHQYVRWTGYGGIVPTFGWRVSGQPDSYAGPLLGGFTWPSALRIHKDQFWVGTWFWNYPGFVNGQWNCIQALSMTTGLGVGWLGGAINTSTMVPSAGYFTPGAPLQPLASQAHSVSPGVFSSPRQFVWHGDLIYVVDNTSDPVLSIFDEKGVMQPGRLSHLSGVGEKPFAIAVDRFGNVIVSDMYTGSVRFFTTKLDAAGELTQAAEWQLDTPSIENVKYPIISDLAFDGKDNLYVAATTKNKVYKIRLKY